MLDLTQIQSIAHSSSPQDLFAALVWQCRFNAFDGPEVIRDLALHPELWVSFLFSKPILAPDATGVSFSGVIETLLAMANYRPLPATSLIHFTPYPADTLYVLTRNQETTVSSLLDLGKKWRADSIDLCDGTQEDYGWQLRRGLWSGLNTRFGDEEGTLDRDAVVIAYWWD